MSPIVERKALDLGDPGRRWLADLPRLVAELAQRWSLGVGEPLDGASASHVVRVTTADGRSAVLKLGLPEPAFASQVRTLVDARGHGYARVLDTDPTRYALLLEALGPSLDRSGLAPEEQIEVLCRTLQQAWRVPRPAGSAVYPKARELAAAITGRPLPGPVAEQTLEFARRRAIEPERSVVVHGDPHPGNALRRDAGYVFVDPDGLVADPAYDLGVVLRDWCPQLLAGDALATARRYCALMADLTGVDGAAIWEWGFLERVSTGLYVLDLGAPEKARPFLETAELLIGS